MKTHTSGFTLIEIVVVMAIVSVLFAMMLGAANALQGAQLRSNTTKVIERADTALAGFVMVSKRLPCPADGGLPPTDPNYGKEGPRDVNGDCQNNQVRGVVPWRSLGLTVFEVTDGYSGVLTYRAALGLTRANALDLSGCDVAATPASQRNPAVSSTATGAAPNQACVAACVTAGAAGCCSTANLATSCTTPTDVLAGRGLSVRDTTKATFAVLADPAANPPTAAAYILLSHGPNRSGGYTPDGVAQGTLGATGDDEVPNAAVTAIGGYYVDQGLSEANTTAHFDDMMVRPTILQVANRAALGPRVHN